MKHMNPISKSSQPLPATTLLQWQQIGVVFGGFATALGTLVTAVGNYFTNVKPHKES
jgi:hypothetical protein